MSMRESAAFAVLVAMVAGLVVWASALTTVYALFSLGCIYGWNEPRLAGLPLWHAVVIAAWLAHVALNLGVVAWSLRRYRAGIPVDAPGTARFLGRSAVAIAVIGVGATAWTGLPALIVYSCH